MDKKAQKAFTELKDLGVHVLGPEMGWTGHFAISAECHGDGSEGDKPELKLSFYEDYFGGNTVIPGILLKHGLYFEWQNAGVATVHEV